MTDAQEIELDRDEDEYALDEKVVSAILDAVGAGDAGAIDTLMEPLHAADIADLLEQIGSSDRAALLALWSRGIDGEILSELDESITRGGDPGAAGGGADRGRPRAGFR